MHIVIVGEPRVKADDSLLTETWGFYVEIDRDDKFGHIWGKKHQKSS